MRVLLIIFFIYLFFRILVRYILPWLVLRYVNKSKEEFYRDNPQYSERQQKKEGEMTISIKRTSQGKPNSDKIGDYTDFEEIKDNE